MNKANKKRSKKGFKLRPIPQEILKTGKVDKSQLWFLLINGSPVGPYNTDDLKIFFEQNPNFPLETYISNYAHTKWMPIYKCNTFTSVESIQKNLSIKGQENIYFLKDGQKIGPFTSAQIKSKLDTKELIYTDLISTPPNFNWRKITEHPFFDTQKGTRSPTPLPDAPEDFIHLTGHELMEELQIQNSIEEDDGLIGLAYIGKNKGRTTFSQEERPKPIAEEIGRPLPPTNWSKILLFGIALPIGLLVIFFAIYQFYPDYEDINPKTKEDVVEKETSTNRTGVSSQKGKIKSTSTTSPSSTISKTERKQRREELKRKREEEKKKRLEERKERQAELQKQRLEKRRQQEEERRKRKQEEIDLQRDREYEKMFQEQENERLKDEKARAGSAGIPSPISTMDQGSRPVNAINNLQEPENIREDAPPDEAYPPAEDAYPPAEENYQEEYNTEQY